MGFFGVGGKHFALLFFMREVLEAALQSIQAYQLSKYVPRLWLNRTAVVLVVMSCWSTPAISRLMANSPRAELILCLLLDTVLDVVPCIGVPLALGAMYLPEYSFAMTAFLMSRWIDNAWVANLSSEFKQLFIRTWLDFATRVLFAITALLSLHDVKVLAMPSAALADAFMQPRVAAPETTTALVPRRHRIEKILRMLLLLWGVVVLALHVESMRGREVDEEECRVNVRPWLTSKVSCAAFEINCLRHSAMTGTRSEVDARWSEIDPQVLSMLIIRNCSAFDMPASIQSFSTLMAIYIHNTTVVAWSETAAVTKHHHPELRQISLISVNMTPACDASSSLPPGLVAHDFPPTLGTLLSTRTALDKLPANLHEIWPRGMVFLLFGSFTSVPDVLVRMKPARLIIQRSNLTSVPPEVFAIPTLERLQLDMNPISELPDDATPSPALQDLTLTSTNISSLPSWTQREPFRSRVRVYAASTPFCAKLALDPERAALVKFYCSPLLI